MEKEVHDAILAQARKQFESEGLVDIDDDPPIKLTERGAYVQAWVWVEDVDVDLPEKYYKTDEDIWIWPGDKGGMELL